MDLLTRDLVPRFDYGPDSTAEDYNLMLSLELLSGKLINRKPKKIMKRSEESHDE